MKLMVNCNGLSLDSSALARIEQAASKHGVPAQCGDVRGAAARFEVKAESIPELYTALTTQVPVLDRTGNQVVDRRGAPVTQVDPQHVRAATDIAQMRFKVFTVDSGLETDVLGALPLQEKPVRGGVPIEVTRPEKRR